MADAKTAVKFKLTAAEFDPNTIVLAFSPIWIIRKNDGEKWIIKSPLEDKEFISSTDAIKAFVDTYEESF